MVHGQGMAQAGARVRTRGHEGCNGAAQGLGPGGHEGDRLSWYRGREGCHALGTSGCSSQVSWVPGCTLVSGCVTSRNIHVTLLTNLGQFRTCHIPCHTPGTSPTSEL